MKQTRKKTSFSLDCIDFGIWYKPVNVLIVGERMTNCIRNVPHNKSRLRKRCAYLSRRLSTPEELIPNENKFRLRSHLSFLITKEIAKSSPPPWRCIWHALPAPPPPYLNLCHLPDRLSVDHDAAPSLSHGSSLSSLSACLMGSCARLDCLG